MIRKIFKLIPKGIQERVKLFYYNRKIGGFSFSVENGYYKTTVPNSWSILSLSPLYFIIKDVQRYERFYQVLPEDVIIDAGANEGILSLIYSKKVKEKGKVYAFEPDNKNVESLEKNFALNTEINNIDLHGIGLWSKPNKIAFFEAGTVGSSMFYEGSNAVKKEIEVTSIDEFVRKNHIKRLDFIKMDIEGAEIEAIPGAVETIKSFRPNFSIASYHKVNGDLTYRAIEDFFKMIDYPFKTIFYEDGEIITYAGDNLVQRRVMK